MSQSHSINASVPQGSILGPLLFILYVDDLVQTMGIPVYIYADDIAIVYEFKTQESVHNVLQEEIDKLQAWSERWKVKLNATKTDVMVVSRKNPRYKPVVKLDGVELNEVDHFKYLGITCQTTGHGIDTSRM